MCLCVPFHRRSLQFLVRVFPFLSLILNFNYILTSSFFHINLIQPQCEIPKLIETVNMSRNRKIILNVKKRKKKDASNDRNMFVSSLHVSLMIAGIYLSNLATVLTTQE